MESNQIEKKIKDHLKGFENFDGDKMAMWAAIDKDLDRKKKRRWFIFWFGGLGFAIGLLLLLFWRNDAPEISTGWNAKPTNTLQLSTTKNGSKETQISANDIGLNNENNALTKDPIVEASTNPTTATKQVEEMLLTERKAKLKKDNSISHNATPSITTAPSTINFTIANTTTNEDISADEKGVVPNLTDNLKINSNDKQPIKAVNEQTKKSSLEKLENINELLNVPIDSILIDKGIIAPELTLPADDNQTQWSISVAAGINNQLSNYKSVDDLAALRNATETNLEGWQMQLELSRHFDRDISLTTGLQFSRAWTKFEFDRKEVTAKLLENVITTYHINTHWFENDTILEYGTGVILSKTERAVQHHNRFDKIQIPLMIAKHYQKGKFTLACQTGIGLDIWMHRSGKNILRAGDIETIIAFNQSNSNNYNKIGASAKLRLMLGLSLTDRMNIYLQPAGNLSLSDWSVSDDDLTRKPFTYGVNLGVNYRIK